jgi:hypothetical protein
MAALFEKSQKCFADFVAGQIVLMFRAVIIADGFGSRNGARNQIE